MKPKDRLSNIPTNSPENNINLNDKCPSKFPYKTKMSSHGPSYNYCFKNEKCIDGKMDCSDRKKWVHRIKKFIFK